jgi:hypothetical protein
VGNVADALSISKPARRPRRVVGRIACTGVGLLAAAAGGPIVSSAAAADQPAWSPTVSLVRCSSVAAPRVVFPAADPFHAGGQGGIVWSGDPADCNPANAASGPGLGIAEFEPDHTLGAPTRLQVTGPSALTSLSAATSTGDGRIVLAGDAGPAASAEGGVSEGLASGPFTGADLLGGPSTPIAVTSSYRGDVAIASVSAGGKVELRVEPHDTPAISPPVVLTPRGGVVTAITVNLDYRGDAIVAWAENGGIYARVRSSTGSLQQTQRIASSPPAPRLEALISDDDRGILAWESDTTTAGSATSAVSAKTSPRATAAPPGSTTTSAYLDVSQEGVRFGRPNLLERFTDPGGLVPPATGLQLVRLAYEGVIVAWTGRSGAHLVIRTAPVSLSSLRPATTISDPDADAMLTDLATGPQNEAIALWTAAPRSDGQPEDDEERILSARGISDPSGVTKFDTPQLVAGPGPVATPRVAIDPVTDVAVAVWRKRGPNPGIEYAVRASNTSGAKVAGRRGAPQPRHGGRTVVTLVIGILLAIGGVLVGLRRRARAKEERRRRTRVEGGEQAGRTPERRSLSRRLIHSLNLTRSDS